MGNTNGNVVISYDIDSMHTQVKQAMKNLDYFDNCHYGDGSDLLYDEHHAMAQNQNNR